MSAFKRKGQWVAKFQLRGEQHWVPGPWATRRQALEAERRHRDRLEARRTNETCASFSEQEDERMAVASALVVVQAVNGTAGFPAVPCIWVSGVRPRRGPIGSNS